MESFAPILKEKAFAAKCTRASDAVAKSTVRAKARFVFTITRTVRVPRSRRRESRATRGVVTAGVFPFGVRVIVFNHRRHRAIFVPKIAVLFLLFFSIFTLL